jgi:hypothetical protein
LRKGTAQRLGAGLAVIVGLTGVALWRARSASRTAAEDHDGVGDGARAAPPEPAAPAAQPIAAPLSPDRARPSSPSAASSAAAALVARLDEAHLMDRLRHAVGTDTALTIELAREGNRRFPDSADAPERASILIHALANQGQAREARGEAEYMVNHYPDSSWVREIEQFTGAHRHRNIIITDAGTVQYQ